MNWKALGVLVGAIFLVALNGVFLGAKSQKLDPLHLLFWSYLGATLFFGVGRLGELRAFLRRCRAHAGRVLLINVLTSGCCFGFFFAVKFIEPALASVIASAIGPILAVALPVLLSGRKESLEPRNLLSSVGIGLSLMLVIHGILDGRSAIARVDGHANLLGIGMAVLLGVSQMLYVVFSRELSERGGFSVSQLMSVRFLSTILLSFLLADGELFTWDAERAWVSLLVCVLGVLIPLYMIQYSISRLEPFVVATVLVMQALFMSGLQLFDPRLRPSLLSVTGVALATAFSVFGIYSQQRSGPPARAAALKGEAS